jgi:hypothetical protein
MKIALPITAGLCAAATLMAAMPAEARINQRQHNQQHRIAAGIYNGSLSARETVRLERKQIEIARYEARSRADGPGLTRYERARIETMQDRASASIRRQKHDYNRR